MKTAVKLEVKDIEKLHALVIENAAGLETGLTVLDYRLLLGHATIDAVARDASGSLVLMAIGFTADEEMLLKAVEAYSWCLEYPDAIRRLYTGVELSEARPPRLVFVIERMPDSFHRKMKQLGFPDVDCIEFRLLDVDGTPAVYFERLARLRRTSISEPSPRHEVASPVAVEPVTENVVTAGGAQRAAGGAQRAASARVQKLLTQANTESIVARPAERPTQVAAPVREVAPVVSMISRTSAAPVVEAAPAPVAVVKLVPEPEPAPRVEPNVEAPAAVVAVEPSPIVEAIPLEIAIEPAAPNGHVAQEPMAETRVVPVVELKPEPVAFREVVQVTEPKTAQPTPSIAEPKRVSFAEAAAKALLQQTRPAAPAQVEEIAPEAAAQPKPVAALPPGFEGLQLPGDGQLTRQWMEFLNQMAAAKK